MNYSIVFIFLTIGLSACGQTGPLYLPGEPPPIHVEPEREIPEITETQPGQQQ
jgi:predicted small lipoprotein YifL